MLKIVSAFYILKYLKTRRFKCVKTKAAVSIYPGKATSCLKHMIPSPLSSLTYW